MAVPRRRPAARVLRASQDDAPVRLLEQERLLVEAAQKNPTRFGELYELNFERVYAFIVSRVRDRDAAEDLTSDVFHRALANLNTFRMARRAFRRLAVPHCSQRHRGPLEARGEGGSEYR